MCFNAYRRLQSSKERSHWSSIRRGLNGTTRDARRVARRDGSKGAAFHEKVKLVAARQSRDANRRGDDEVEKRA